MAAKDRQRLVEVFLAARAVQALARPRITSLFRHDKVVVSNVIRLETSKYCPERLFQYSISVLKHEIQNPWDAGDSRHGTTQTNSKGPFSTVSKNKGPVF